MPVMMSSGRRRLCALALLIAALPVAMAIDPPQDPRSTVALERIIESWERTDARLNALLGEVPPAAHDGINRAIEANRAGRERALAALESDGGDTTAGRARAHEALAAAAENAERGLAQAREHVPEHVLPRLDDAAARMREGIGKGASAAPTEASPSSNADRPSAGNRPVETRRPDATGRPGMSPPVTSRPSGAGRQPNPGRRPGG